MIKFFDILSEEFLIIKFKYFKVSKVVPRVLLSKSRMIDSIANTLLYERALSKRKIRNISNDKLIK